MCGFRTWIELGYCVRKGERAIRILAPMKMCLAADDPTTVNGDGEDDERVFFRAVPVFDRSQGRAAARSRARAARAAHGIDHW